jgi:hypothetical protein
VPPMLAERWLTGELPPMARRQRVLMLNLYNIALSVAIAALLFRITGLYASDPFARSAFVLAALYGTFLWNYLRAQSSEIFQVLFFLAFYPCFARFLRSLFPPAGTDAPPLRTRDLALSWLFIGMLCLTRVSYALLMAAPWLAVGCGLVAGRRPPLRAARSLAAPMLAGTACVLAALAGVNWLKFGSPLSTGYHQWAPETAALSGSLAVGLHGFLLTVQKSIFINFPLLVIALFGLPAFARRHPADAAFIAAVLAGFLLVIGKMPVWRGDWCYGPRYLLFALPAASLPAVPLLERWIGRPSLPSSLAGLLASSLVVAASVAAQVEVNRLPFFTFFEILSPIEADAGPATSAYFRDSHFARVNADLVRARSDPDSLVYVRELREKRDGKRLDAYIALLEEASATPNYYWRDYRPVRSLWRRFTSLSWL